MNGLFSADVTCMRKFDYYLARKYKQGQATGSNRLIYAWISACNYAYEIVWCEALNLFVEQREHFQLSFIASLYDFLVRLCIIVRLSLIEIQVVETHPFLPKGFL